MCNCILETDVKLKPFNCHIVATIPVFDQQNEPSKAFVLTELNNEIILKSGKPKANQPKPMRLVANFCPFCGEKYVNPNPTELSGVTIS